jgi:hypothetical protein
VISGEPLFTLEQAARMVPMPSVNALRILLCRHPQLAAEHYAPGRAGAYRQPARMLTLGEIDGIRRHRVKENVSISVSISDEGVATT